ncbi:hypothetical protein K6L05_12445 [Salinicoccus roseus]|uniref:hypothetical protein n=1 Tax=Salinicoccus roseus TaxID=45670 RepID=UPI001CA63081|nr:hypothetical protein [Salinicoccus roseus]MBY8910576.1 hypothetical protein [Salinicoccus roseus]
MYKKIILSLAVTLITFSGLLSNLTYATEIEEKNYTQKEVNQEFSRDYFLHNFPHLPLMSQNGKHH